MKVSRKKYLQAINNEDHLTYLDIYMTQAKNMYNKENRSYRNKNKLFISSNESVNKNLTMTENYHPNKKKYNSRLYNIRYNDDDENFNILKKINEIKEITNKSYNTNDPFLRNKLRVPYDINNADVVFDAHNQILSYKKKEDGRLLDKGDSLYKFYVEKKATAIDNVIINLLNKESNKLRKIEEENNKKIEEINKKDIRNKNYFEEYSYAQKIEMKKIDKALTNIEEKYRQLLFYEKDEKGKMNIINDEMVKKLYQIEDLRIYAQFVNDVLNGQKKYDKSTLKLDDEYLKKNHNIITTEDLVNQCFINYGFIIDPNNEKENNEALKLIQDPDMFIDEFHKIENKIIKKLEIYENKQNNKRKINQERIDQINELNNQLDFYNKEYLFYDNNLKKLIEEYSKIASSKIKDNSDAIDLIKEIHLEYTNKDTNIIGTRISYNKQKSKQIQEIIKEVINKCKTQERKVNSLISFLEYQEMHDPNTFIPVMIERRKDNKAFKQKNARNKIDEELEAKNLVSKKKFDKVINQSRKTLPPPFRIRKRIIKENIDAEKNQENKDLLNLLFY